MNPSLLQSSFHVRSIFKKYFFPAQIQEQKYSFIITSATSYTDVHFSKEA